MKKSRRQIIIISLLFAVLLGAAGYVLNTRYHFLADTLTERINSSIVLSQIATTGEVDSAKPVNSIQISIPKGEKEAVAVLLENKSGVDYSNLSIEKDDLVSSQGQTISKNNIDERVIHSWPQKLIDWSKAGLHMVADPVNVDELLVRNEKPNLALPTGAKYNGDLFFSNDIGANLNQLLTSGGSAQNESSNGSTEKIKASVTRNQSKKFYFAINVPTDSVGDFAGNIKFVDKAKGQIIAKFQLKLKALPVELVSQNQVNENYQTGCYFNNTIAKNSADTAHYRLSETLVTKRLQLVHSNGCEKIIVRANRFSNNSRLIEILQELKFKGPVIVDFSKLNENGAEGNYKTDTLADTGDISDGYHQFKDFLGEVKDDTKISLPIIFYGIDEPNISGSAQFIAHEERVNNIRKALQDIYGNSLPANISNHVTTSATIETFRALAADGEQYTTEYPIVNYRDAYSLRLSGGQLKTAENQGAYYFQGFNEIKNNWGYQNINRYLAGIGLAKSGFKGYMINPTYGYYGVDNRPLYDDFTIPDEANGDWHKQMMIFAPAVDGFIPTLQSEGWRDGSLDLRYYLTYQNALKNKSNISQSKIRQLATLESTINTQLEKYNPAFDKAYRLPNGLTDKDMDNTRNLLTEYLTIYYSDNSTTPLLIKSINLTEGQVITTNPYVISVSVDNPVIVSKVEFFVDDNRIGTSTLPGASGVYSASWDTSKYHSTVRVVATDASGNQSSITRHTSVQLSKPAAPPVISSLNISDKYKITTNPFVLKVKATDSLAITKVEFSVDGHLAGTATSVDKDGYYSHRLSFASQPHSLMLFVIGVKVYNTANKSAEVKHTVQVILPTTAPVITSVNVPSGTTLMSSPYTIEVKATDAAGIAKVDFYANNLLLDSQSSINRVTGSYNSSLDASKYNKTTVAVKIVVTNRNGVKTVKQYSLPVNIPLPRVVGYSIRSLLSRLLFWR